MRSGVLRRIVSIAACALAVAVCAAPAGAASTAASRYAEPVLELDAVQVAVGEVGIDMRVLNPASRPAVGPIVVTNVLPTGAQVVGDPTGPWSCSGEPLRCIADQQQIAAHGATGRLSLKARIPGSKRTVTVRWVPVVRTAHGAVPAQPVVLQVAERAPEDVGPIARIDGFFEPDGRPRAGAASTATLEVVNEGETTIHAVTARLRPVHGARVLRASGTGWTCTGTTCSFAGTLTRGDVAAPLSVEYRAPRSATGARSLVAAVVRATRTRGYAMLSADVAPPLALSATAEPSSLVEEAVKASRVVDLTALGDGGTDTALSYRWSQVCPRVGCPVTARWQTPRTDPVARVLIPEHEGDVTLTFRVVADDGSAKSAHTVRVRSIGDLGASGQNVARTAIGTRGADIGTRFSSWGTTDVSIGILDGKRIRASGPYWRTEYDGTWHLRGMAGPTFDGSLDCFGDSCQGTLEGDGALPVLASLGLTAHTTLEVQDDTVAFASYIDPPTRGGAPAAVLEGTIDASGAVHAELTAVIPLGSARLSFSRAPLVRDRSGRIVKAPVGALTAPTTLGALALDSASARWEADAIHLTGQARPLVGPIAGQAAGAITGAVRSPSDWNVDLARRPLASPFDIGGVSVTDLGVTSRSASTGYAYDLHGRLHNAPSSPSAGLVLDTAEATSPGLCAPGCALHGAAQARIRGRLVLRPRSAAHGGDLTAPVELHGAIAAGAPHRFATAPFSLPLATGLSLDGAVLALDVADGTTTAASMTGRLASASGQLGGATTATFTPEGFHLATPLGDWTPPGQLAGSAVVVRGASLLISASPSPVRIVSPAGEATLPAYGGLLVGTLGLPAWALAIAPAAEGTALAAPLALDPALVFAGPVAMGTGRTLVGSETSASSVAAGAVYFDIRDALTAGRVSPRLVIDATVRTPGSAPFGATLYAHDGSGGAAQISTAAAGSIAAAGGVADLAVRDAAVTGRVTATSSALTLRGLPTMPAAVRTALALKSTARLAITLPLDGTTTAYALAFGAPDGPRVADVFGKGDVLARGGVVSIDARAGGASGPLAVTLDSELLGEPVAMNGTIDVNAGSASLQARRVSVRLGPAVFKWTDVDATTTAGTPDFAVAVDGWLEFLDDLTEMRGTIVRDRSTSSLAYTARLRGTAPDASILAEPVPLTGGGNMNLDVRGVVDGNGFSVRHARAEFKSSLKILGKTKTDMDFVVGFSRYGLVDTLLLNTQFEAKFSYGSAAGQATVGMERFLPKGVFMGAIALNGVPLQWWFGSFDGPLKSATIGTARYSSYGRNLGVVDFRVTVKYRLTTTIGVATFAANAHGSADAEVDVYGCFWRGGWCGWTGIGAELGFGFNPYSVKVGVKLPVLGRKTLSF